MNYNSGKPIDNSQQTPRNLNQSSSTKNLAFQTSQKKPSATHLVFNKTKSTQVNAQRKIVVEQSAILNSSRHQNSLNTARDKSSLRLNLGSL